MFCIALLVHTEYDKYQSNEAGQRHRNDLCYNEHDVANGRPIARKVFAVYEKRKVFARRGGERVKVRRQQYLPLQHVRILRYRWRKRIVYPEQFANIIGDGQSEVLAGFTESRIRLPEHGDQREEEHGQNDRNTNMKPSAHKLPPAVCRQAGYPYNTDSRPPKPQLPKGELQVSS